MELFLFVSFFLLFLDTQMTFDSPIIPFDVLPPSPYDASQDCALGDRIWSCGDGDDEW